MPAKPVADPDVQAVLDRLDEPQGIRRGHDPGQMSRDDHTERSFDTGLDSRGLKGFFRQTTGFQVVRQKPLRVLVQSQANRLSLAQPQGGRAESTGWGHDSERTHFQALRKKARVRLVAPLANGHRLPMDGRRNQDLEEE